MPPETQNDVNKGLGSSPDSQKAAPADLGKNRVMPDGRSVEDVWAENQRKSDELAKVKSKVDEIEEEKAEIAARLAELEEKLNSNPEDKKVQEHLNDPRNRELIEVIEEKAKEQARREFIEIDTEKANNIIVQTAKELGISQKDFIQQLRPFVANVNSTQMPSERNSLAIKAFLSEKERVKSIETREVELKKKEDEFKNFQETGSRIPREQSPIRRVENARNENEIRKATADILRAN